MSAGKWVVSFLMLVAVGGEAFACDPKVEEQHVQTIFQTRALDAKQEQQLFERLLIDGKEIEEAIQNGQVDLACEKIETFKAYLDTFPAK